MTAVWLMPLLLAGATAYDVTFDRATAAYEQGNYEAAIGLYEQLVAEGVVNAGVFYNLGNAYSRAGRLGPAIANYERALHEAPGFEPARANLAQCVAKSKRRLARPISSAWQTRLLPWGHAWSPPVVSGLAIFCWFLAWILLALRLLTSRRYLRRAAALLGALAMALGLTAFAQTHPPLLAVVSQESVKARLEARESEVRHELFEGDRVLVEERQGGWARVSTAAGETGWVPTNSLALVGPPYGHAPRPMEAATAVENPA